MKAGKVERWDGDDRQFLGGARYGNSDGQNRAVSRYAGAFSPAAHPSGTAPLSEEAFQAFFSKLHAGIHVKHVKFGEGVIVRADEKVIRILFADEARNFQTRTLAERKLLTVMEK